MVGAFFWGGWFYMAFLQGGISLLAWRPQWAGLAGFGRNCLRTFCDCCRT